MASPVRFSASSRRRRNLLRSGRLFRVVVGEICSVLGGFFASSFKNLERLERLDHF